MWGRLEARKYGIELPDIRSEHGLVAGRLWAEVAQRQRDQQFELLTRFLPQLLYAMAGLPPTVAFTDRMSVLGPALRELRASMLGIQRTSVYREQNIRARLSTLYEQREGFSRVDRITQGTYTIADFLTGKE